MKLTIKTPSGTATLDLNDAERGGFWHDGKYIEVFTFANPKPAEKKGK